ncbi:MAG: PIN domain-containing protein [Coriobacteriia bacterium]
MNVVDSSGWLEYFAEGPSADFFAEALQDTKRLVVPTVTVYEVYKVACKQSGEREASAVVTQMYQGHLVDLDSALAVSAARLSAKHGLPMADAIILATARSHQATFWTQDAHFAGLDGVQYSPRP